MPDRFDFIKIQNQVDYMGRIGNICKFTINKNLNTGKKWYGKEKW